MIQVGAQLFLLLPPTFSNLTKQNPALSHLRLLFPLLKLMETGTFLEQAH